MSDLIAKYIDYKINIENKLYDALFLDFNDTAIKTGVLTKEEISWENDRIFDFIEILKIIGNHYDKISKTFYVNIVTGNSYDYVRGRLEFFDIHRIKNVDLNFITENGLFAQGQKTGMLWSGVPDANYIASIKKMDLFAGNNLPNKFFLQGNMIRRTYKPTGPDFDAVFVAPMIKFAREECNMKPYDGNWDSGNGTIYYHKNEALDVDPRNVKMIFRGDIPDQDIVFKGKAFAINKLSEWFRYENSLAFGDSKNDIPMFEEIRKNNGQVFAVSNHRFSEEQIKENNIEIINHIRMEAINSALVTWIDKMGLK